MRSAPSLWSVPNIAFETVPIFVRLRMTFSRPFKENRLALSLRLYPPGDQSCDVLCFVPAGSVSSFSTLQIFRKESHLWGLLCPPDCLLGRFPSLQHVQGNTPTGVFQGGCRPSTRFSLGFSFHFSLFAASLLNLWGWWHVWSDCHFWRQSRYLLLYLCYVFRALINKGLCVDPSSTVCLQERQIRIPRRLEISKDLWLLLFLCVCMFFSVLHYVGDCSRSMKSLKQCKS